MVAWVTGSLLGKPINKDHPRIKQLKMSPNIGLGIAKQNKKKCYKEHNLQDMF